METIHIMDGSFSIHQHLMNYGDKASLESEDRKGSAMPSEKSGGRSLFITATSYSWVNEWLVER
jgi:hypothetical protein